ncbi:hypothetical protein AVEN_107075-1 [Araneus ventricosus]|uniref:Uncharacterized protein n=1 Tax=Araneus ventricosus TaxID=182803 RepID=A0A4Y2V1Y7_ARAVE|nr:hypothetical protein AVEN_107075-1 [Araneus ventricosus]
MLLSFSLVLIFVMNNPAAENALSASAHVEGIVLKASPSFIIFDDQFSVESNNCNRYLRINATAVEVAPIKSNLVAKSVKTAKSGKNFRCTLAALQNAKSVKTAKYLKTAKSVKAAISGKKFRCTLAALQNRQICNCGGVNT